MNYINIFVLTLAFANAAQIPSDFESNPYSALKSRIKRDKKGHKKKHSGYKVKCHQSGTGLFCLCQW